eukprot:CAMPEP_0197487912 /NCGR_PEP_ID=MMETSP1311-20131121/2952_1 /TAXON_ID=464262 /ORGANISM="Genus nov. species nov., Strain RCC856" /LENGTH=38 /DNA_ID= /DNA_START= /DNA_END= /DNA_ORIENTATION=
MLSKVLCASVALALACTGAVADMHEHDDDWKSKASSVA